MSATGALTAEAGGSSRVQPFQCSVCKKRFTRHENLKRHAAVHSRPRCEASLACEVCQTTFSRHDLRSRHMKRKHPDWLEGRTTQRRQGSPLRDKPALKEDESFAMTSPEVPQLSLEPRPSLSDFEGASDEWLFHMDPLQTQQQPTRTHRDVRLTGISPITDPTTSIPPRSEKDPRLPPGTLVQQSMAAEARYADPFVQGITDFEQNLSLDQSRFQSTYNFDEQPYLHSQSVRSTAVSETGDPVSYLPDGLSPKDAEYLTDDWFPSPTQSARGYHLYFSHVSQFVPFLHRPTFDATETPRHLGLSMLCLAYQYGEDPDSNDEAGSGALLSQHCFHRARVVAALEEDQARDLDQIIVLVQAYWLLQVYVTLYRCGADSAYGHKMHTRMISLTRSGELTKPMPAKSTTTEDLDELWLEFIKAESHKRTVFAVHQIDTLWYQLFSMPRSLSHLEIKHDLPCREDCWTAVSSAIWAHRELAATQSTLLVPYSDALRVILSPCPEVDTLPQFDLYGAINLAQFLLSSAREVSGWSTMTGRVSLERYEPLQSSLVALERLIRPQAQTGKSIHAASCEATWEMAMLELHLWSPLHTSGIVGGSVDTFLTQSTQLAHSIDLSHPTSTKKAIQRHADWFLQYLENTSSFDSEPPWLILYAYKAFLIVWQCLRAGLPGAMRVVNISDGDVLGAISWAKRVFRRDHRPELSKLIASSLNILVNNK